MPDTFIPFGAQYYRAPTPNPSQWERDIANIREHGFNTIKIWAQWRWNHPKLNTFYFADLDEIMDISARNDIKVVINIIMDVAPAWFYVSHPDSLMITCDGRKVHPQTVGCRQIGGTPGPCFNHPAAKEQKRRFIRELAKRCHSHPALYMWDLWNEPEMSVSVLREPKTADLLCYCENCRKGFVSWLKDKYGSMEMLNSVWGRNYNNWDELELPRCGQTFKDMIDWRMYFSYVLADDLQMRADAVRSFDRDHAVTVHTVPMPYFNRITCCSDDYLLAGICDEFGNSVGSHPFAAASSVSAAPGKRVINAEIHALGGSTYVRPVIPSLSALKKNLFIPLAKGIKGFLFWQYRPETLGLEAPAWGLTDLSGNTTPWLEDTKLINNALQKHADIMDAMKPVPSDIAIVNGEENEIFDWCATGNIDKHYKSVYGVFMALYRAGYNTDVVSCRQLLGEDISRYKVIYYPFPYYMRPDVAEKLRRWVTLGGTLIGEAFFAGISDGDGLHSQVLPGMGFDEVFGAREVISHTAAVFTNSYTSEQSVGGDAEYVGIKTEQGVPAIPAGTTVGAGVFREVLEADKAQVLARFDSGESAVTLSGWGEGRAVLCGTLLGYAYSKYGRPDTAAFIASLVSLGGAVPAADTGVDGVRADILTYTGGYVVALSSELGENRQVTVKSGALKSGTYRVKNIMDDTDTKEIAVGGDGAAVLEAVGGSCEVYILEERVAPVKKSRSGKGTQRKQNTV